MCFALANKVTGLPGGITYALLVLVKTGRLSPLREKAVFERSIEESTFVV